MSSQNGFSREQHPIDVNPFEMTDLSLLIEARWIRWVNLPNRGTTGEHKQRHQEENKFQAGSRLGIVYVQRSQRGRGAHSPLDGTFRP